MLTFAEGNSIMTIELGLLLALVAGILGLATFFIGRQSAAKKDGQEWGTFQAELKKDVEYIKRDVGEIKNSMGDNYKIAMSAIQKEENDRKESDRRIHERIDEIMKSLKEK